METNGIVRTAYGKIDRSLNGVPDRSSSQYTSLRSFSVYRVASAFRIKKNKTKRNAINRPARATTTVGTPRSLAGPSYRSPSTFFFGAARAAVRTASARWPRGPPTVGRSDVSRRSGPSVGVSRRAPRHLSVAGSGASWTARCSTAGAAVTEFLMRPLPARDALPPEACLRRSRRFVFFVFFARDSDAARAKVRMP